MDMKIFEMRMRGFPNDYIANICEMTPIQVEAMLNDFFPTFEMETDAWLESLEKTCLFRGMNVISFQDKDKVEVTNTFALNSAQVEYLKLALDIRLTRYQRWLDSNEKFEEED